MKPLRETLEHRQVIIYFAAIVVAAVVALIVPGTGVLEGTINPALALMLFVTFLQVPLADLARIFHEPVNLGGACTEHGRSMFLDRFLTSVLSFGQIAGATPPTPVTL